MTRPVDELGRVVIPKEIRDSMDIREKDRLEFCIADGRIIMRKTGGRCCMCVAGIGWTEGGVDHGEKTAGDQNRILCTCG